MQIKEAYQKKNKHLSQLRSKTVKIDRISIIGSIHTGQVNYPSQQPFFMGYKVRDSVRQARQQMKALKDRDIFELRDKKWNISTSAPKRFDDFEKDQSHKSKLLKIRLGFSDFSPVKEKSTKIYEGTETRNSFSGWNVSTYVDKKQKDKGYQTTNLNAFDNTIKYNKTKLNNYQTLQQKYHRRRSIQKQQLQNSQDTLEDFKASYLFSNPDASPEKTQAYVHKMFEQSRRQKLKSSYISEKDTLDSSNGSGIFKSKLTPTQKLKIKYIHYHTGNWSKNNTISPQKSINNDSDDDSEGYSWSCCQSNEKEGKGCSYRVQDGNKMNLVSFNYA